MYSWNLALAAVIISISLVPAIIANKWKQRNIFRDIVAVIGGLMGALFVIDQWFPCYDVFVPKDLLIHPWICWMLFGTTWCFALKLAFRMRKTKGRSNSFSVSRAEPQKRFHRILREAPHVRLIFPALVVSLMLSSWSVATSLLKRAVNPGQTDRGGTGPRYIRYVRRITHERNRKVSPAEVSGICSIIEAKHAQLQRSLRKRSWSAHKAMSGLCIKGAVQEFTEVTMLVQSNRAMESSGRLESALHNAVVDIGEEFQHCVQKDNRLPQPWIAAAEKLEACFLDRVETYTTEGDVEGSLRAAKTLEPMVNIRYDTHPSGSDFKLEGCVMQSVTGAQSTPGRTNVLVVAKPYVEAIAHTITENDFDSTNQEKAAKLVSEFGKLASIQDLTDSERTTKDEARVAVSKWLGWAKQKNLTALMAECSRTLIAFDGLRPPPPPPAEVISLKNYNQTIHQILNALSKHRKSLDDFGPYEIYVDEVVKYHKAARKVQFERWQAMRWIPQMDRVRKMQNALTKYFDLSATAIDSLSEGRLKDFRGYNKDSSNAFKDCSDLHRELHGCPIGRSREELVDLAKPSTGTTSIASPTPTSSPAP